MSFCPGSREVIPLQFQGWGPWAEEQLLIGLKRTLDHQDHWKDHGYCPTNQNRLCGYRRPAAHLVHANSYLEFNRLSTRHAENQ